MGKVLNNMFYIGNSRVGFGNVRRINQVNVTQVYTPLADPELFEWWDAQSGISTSIGELTGWLGRKSGATANPPTVTSRPLYGSDQINSLDVLTFRDSDPNYVQIDVSTLMSGVTMQIVIKQTNTNSDVIGQNAFVFVGIRSISGNANTADTNTNLGGNIIFNSNSANIGTNITRGTLYTAISANYRVLTMRDMDLSTVDTLNIGTRGDFSNGLSGQVADIAFYTGSTSYVDNINYFKAKYDL